MQKSQLVLEYYSPIVDWLITVQAELLSVNNKTSYRVVTILGPSSTAFPPRNAELYGEIIDFV